MPNSITSKIVTVIGMYIPLKKSGTHNYYGLCPFHGGKTPSFSVHATREVYHCFGCGVSGDWHSFLERFEGVTLENWRNAKRGPEPIDREG